MTYIDWLLLMCLVVGWTQGLFIGWVLWRKPQLKYHGVEK
jgi:hypothetical protein